MITRSKSESLKLKQAEEKKLNANIDYLKSYIGKNKVRLNFIVDYLRMRNLNKERQIIVDWGKDLI